MKRTIGVLKKVDEVAIFEDASHRIRGDLNECVDLKPFGYIGICNGPRNNCMNFQEIQAFEQSFF